MDTFLIVQTGIYRHEIRGPFAGVDAARAVAGARALLDRDCWHHWEVLRLVPGNEAESVGNVVPYDSAGGARGKPVGVNWVPACLRK